KHPFAAICCLLAIASFYSPLLAAVSAATGMSCCTGRQCSVALHHHTNTPSNGQAHDCDHHAPSVSACSISCCRDSERTILPTTFFIVPEFTFLIGQPPPKPAPRPPPRLQLTF